jgi:hypothetical protein
MDALPVVRSMEELARLIEGHDDLYVRWSESTEPDLRREGSVDGLTAATLPGLSANPLAVEDWWGDRPLEVWAARRLYDYRHLAHRRGRGVHPWVLEGEEIGRGPDNEPLVRCRRPVAWIDEAVVAAAEEIIEASPGEWGPLDREAAADADEGAADSRR